MKTISRVPYALSVCIVGAMLAGCGGSTQFPNPAAQTPVGNAITSKRAASPSFTTPRVGSDSSSTERLIGIAKLKCRYESDIPTTSFRASGTATGPYPGTFTAKGGWWFYNSLQGLIWAFHESFTIRSRTSTVSGTFFPGTEGGGRTPWCRRFVNSVPYTSGSKTGNARVNIQRSDFREDLLSF